jgi:hypothetical protein
MTGRQAMTAESPLPLPYHTARHKPFLIRLICQELFKKLFERPVGL